jgi:hypothetical protein
MEQRMAMDQSFYFDFSVMRNVMYQYSKKA